MGWVWETRFLGEVIVGVRVIWGVGGVFCVEGVECEGVGIRLDRVLDVMLREFLKVFK